MLERLLEDRERLGRLSLPLLHQAEAEKDAAPFAEGAVFNEGVGERKVVGGLIIVARAVIYVSKVLI